MPYSGVTISVTAETNAGGRKHMEDYIAVNLSPNDELLANPDLREQAFVGVFDGHGGKEAAKYAREKLWQVIQEQPKFQTHDPLSVKEAINDAYLQLHEAMLASRDSWVPNKTGDLSTAGTTASTVIFRKNHIFVANVGDSTGIMGVRNPDYGRPGEPPVIAKLLTKDHKPEDPEEQENIKKLGGQVALSMKGVMRVVWERERTKSNGKKETDLIPFLSVARSLGDFWSYNSRSGQYTVSPVPYITDFPLDLHEQKFIVLASDGLWNVMTPSDVVNFIHEYDTTTTIELLNKDSRDVVSALIKEALSRWERRKLQADNIAVLIAYLNEEEIEDDDNNVSSTGEESSESKGTLISSTSDIIAVTSNELHVSPPSSSLSPPSSSSSILPFEKKEFSQSATSSSEYVKKVLPNGSTIEFENVTKYRHRRKHKKNKKHSKHKHRRLSPPHNNHTEEKVNMEDEDENNAAALIPPVVVVAGEEAAEGTSCIDEDNTAVLIKRRHTPLLEEDDEGVSLLPPDYKRHKYSPDSLSSSGPLPGGLIRSQRISTDNRSDSGSSGIVSDMDSTNSTVLELGPSPPSNVHLSEPSLVEEEEEEEEELLKNSEELMDSSATTFLPPSPPPPSHPPLSLDVPKPDKYYLERPLPTEEEAGDIPMDCTAAAAVVELSHV